jgi:hypothetical protein
MRTDSERRMLTSQGLHDVPRVVEHGHQLVDLAEELVKVLEGFVQPAVRSFVYLSDDAQPEVAAVREGAFAREQPPVDGLMVIWRPD